MLKTGDPLIDIALLIPRPVVSLTWRGGWSNREFAMYVPDYYAYSPSEDDFECLTKLQVDPKQKNSGRRFLEVTTHIKDYFKVFPRLKVIVSNEVNIFYIANRITGEIVLHRTPSGRRLTVEEFKRAFAYPSERINFKGGNSV